MKKLGAIAGAGLALVWLAAPSAAVPPGRLSTPGAVGTVDTVAGPGFCDGPSTPDPASTDVGELATDATGAVWYESGPLGQGVFTKVINSNSVTVVRPGFAPYASGHEDDSQDKTAAPRSASRLAGDGEGGLLVASATAIQHLSTGLSTIAGSTATAGASAPSSSGDGGPVQAARFTRIGAIAGDHAGNVYVADQIDPRTGRVVIRFLNRSDEPVTFHPGTPVELAVAPGTVETVADDAGTPLGTNGRGPRVAASLPVLAVASGRLYIGRTFGGSRSSAEVHVLNLGGRNLEAHGATVAPGALARVASVDVPAGNREAAAGRLSALSGIAADGEGNLFLAEQANHRIRRVNAVGDTAVVAGTGAPGFSGEDRPALRARLRGPFDVEVGPGGRLFISDAGNRRVRVLEQAGRIRPALGNGAATAWVCADLDGDKGSTPAPPAQPAAPTSLARDSAGNVYVVPSTLRRVHRLTRSASLVPIAGRPDGFCGDQTRCLEAHDAPPGEVDLTSLVAVASGQGGGLYLAEGRGLRFLNLAQRSMSVHGVRVDPGAIRMVAGKPAASKAADPPPALAPPPSTPNNESALGAAIGTVAVSADHDGNVFIGDVPAGPLAHGAGSILQVNSRGVISTLVPRRDLVKGLTDPLRCCSLPADLTNDASGNLYIADTLGGRVWFLNRGPAAVVVHGVSVTPGALEVVAGAGPEGSQDEGIPARAARLSRPAGITLDGSGNLFVVDVTEHAVHRVDLKGTIVTVAGTGQPGFNGDGLKGELTSLSEPRDVALDGCGNLLIADSGNNRVRRLNIVAGCPARRSASRPSRSGGALPAALAAGAVVVVAAVAFHRRRRSHPR